MLNDKKNVLVAKWSVPSAERCVSLHCDCLSERLGAVPAQRTSGCSRSRGAPALHPLSQTAPLLTGEILKPCTVQMWAQNWFSLCTTSGLRFCDVSATLTTCYSNLSLLRPSSEMGISVSQLKYIYIYIYIYIYRKRKFLIQSIQMTVGFINWEHSNVLSWNVLSWAELNTKVSAPEVSIDVSH